MSLINFKVCIFLLVNSLMVNFISANTYESSPIDSQHAAQIELQIENQELELERQFKNQQQQQLNQWVLAEITHNEQFHELQPYESVAFLINPQEVQTFRIPVSLDQRVLIGVSLFEILDEKQFAIPQNPEQENYISVSALDSPQDAESVKVNVYIQRLIQINFTKNHKYLKFKNNANHQFIVLLDIEQEQLLMEIVVSDDQFALTNKKMQTILQETKSTEINREHIYKWQWGFYQKHQRHQADMLGFTGAELIAIIGTSIVQMYCIKNLINNELII